MNENGIIKPWQNDWTFALNMDWTNVQCKMLRRFATLSNLVQSCSAMLRAVQSSLKAVKNVQWTRLNFFCFKKMFSRFATPLNIVQLAHAHCKCNRGQNFLAPAPFCFSIPAQRKVSCDYSEEMAGTGSYEDSFHEISSDGDRREQDDDVDRPSSSSRPRSSTPDSSSDESVRAMNSVLSKAKRVSKVIKRKSNNAGNTKFNGRTSSGDKRPGFEAGSIPESKKKEKKAKTDVPAGTKLTQKETKKWSNDDVSLLIELLEERACLWNVYDKSYHLKDVRDRALNEMSDCLDASPADIKTKILTLRSQLGREITKVNRTKSGQSTDQLYRSTWMYWDRLQFLRPVLQPGKSRDSLQGSLNDTENENPELDKTSDGDHSKSAPRQTSTPKLKKGALEEKKVELMNTCIAALKEPANPAKQPDQCHFSLFVREKLQSFDHRARVVAEKRISDIIFDIEMNGVNMQMTAAANNSSASPFSQMRYPSNQDHYGHTATMEMPTASYLTMLN